MKFGETLRFNKKKYEEELQRKDLSHIELAKEIYRKRAKRLSAKVHAGTGVAAAVVTGGHSLVATALSSRNISVESQKIKILEAEWARRGHPPLKESKLKDKVFPITVAFGTSLFTIGLDVALANAAPDQFYQFTPDPELNEFLIGNVYYKGVEKAATTIGNAAVKRVVSRAPKSASEGGSSSSSYGRRKGEESDEENNNEKYSDGSDEEEDFDDDEEEEEEDYSDAASDDESDYGRDRRRRYV